MFFFLFSNVVRCSQKPMEQGDFDRVEQQLLHQLQPNSLKETRGLHGVQGWSTAPLGMYILLSKNINICTRARHLYVTLSTDSAYMLYKAWYISKVTIVLLVEVCKKEYILFISGLTILIPFSLLSPIYQFFFCSDT